MAREIEGVAAGVARPGTMVLDFGCGDRPYERLFTDRGAAYSGADFGAIAEYEVRPDGHVSAPDDAFDVVVSFQVLEHVRDVPTYLQETRRVLRADGLLLLSTHGNWFYHPHPEDHRRWTREGLIAELGGQGFAVYECHPVVGPLAYASVLRMTIAAYALRKLPLVGRPLAGLLCLVENAISWACDWATPRNVTADNACVYVTLSRREPKAS